MFRVLMAGSSSNASQVLKTLAQRGSLLRSQLRARGPAAHRFSTRGTDPTTLTESMSAHPWAVLSWGTTIGYFSAMYMERTVYKDEFVRDDRHKAKTTTGAVTGLPTAK